MKQKQIIFKKSTKSINLVKSTKIKRKKKSPILERTGL